VSDVEIVRRSDAPAAYFLSHGFDLDLIEGAPCEGPYRTRDEAEKAAEQLLLAVTCTDG
jgi:hypothetical protein